MNDPQIVTFLGNNELALHVPDPSAAENFYSRILGCTVVDRTPDCISLTYGVVFDVIERRSSDN